MPIILFYRSALCLPLLLLAEGLAAEPLPSEPKEAAAWSVSGPALSDWVDAHFLAADRPLLEDALSDLATGNTHSLPLLIAKLEAVADVAPLFNREQVPPLETLHQFPAEIVDAIALSMATTSLHAERYEETQSWLNAISSDKLSSSEQALYLSAVAHHQLLDYDTAKTQAEALLELAPSAARRYRQIATLLLKDIESVRPDSLDSIARQMDDAERRLRLTQTDEQSLKTQDDILAALDKMIKDLEDQQKKQQQQQQAAAQGSPSSSPKPMEDSKASELKAPGDLHRRLIDAGGDWGSLPPAERERVTQQISRDFPARYRDVIQQYFRALAEGTDTADPAPRPRRGDQ